MLAREGFTKEVKLNFQEWVWGKKGMQEETPGVGPAGVAITLGVSQGGSERAT